MNFITKHKLKIIIILWVLLFTAGTVLYVYGITHEAFWFDEAFTASITEHSFIDIVKITSKDVHPPLYYLMIKLYKMLFGNSELSLRLFSVMGGLLLASLGAGPVRKIFGNITGMIYTLLIFTVPIFSSLAQNARMYTWACFFVTACALFACLIVMGNKKTDWILLILFSLAASYTHYFGLIAAGLILFVMMIYIIIKQRKLIVPFFVSSGIIFLLYLPWLIILFLQISSLRSEGFWIDPVDLKAIKEVVFYPFNNKFSFPSVTMYSMLSYGLLTIIIISGFIISFIKKEKNKLFNMFFYGIYLLTIITGLILSITIQPVLVDRYIFIVTGLLIISTAFGIRMLRNKYLIILASVLIVFISIPQILYNNKNRLNGPVVEVKEYLKKNQLYHDDVFLHNNVFTYGTMCYYYPHNKHFLYHPDDYEQFINNDAFYPVGFSGENYINFIKGKKRIWVVEMLGDGNLISDESIIYYGNMKKIEKSPSFNIEESWMKMRLALFVRTDENIIKEYKSSNIQITCENFRSNSGQALCIVYKGLSVINPENFLFITPAKIKNKKSVFNINNIPHNTYAFLVFHDENYNHKFDINEALRYPIEGFNYSNNDKMPDAPISIKKNGVNINSEKESISIRMFYPEF